jgi:hypothetical protein
MFHIVNKNIKINHEILIRFLTYYTLTLFVFSFIYYVIYQYDKKSFTDRNKITYNLFDFFYFSLVTQTTVGYGSMVPTSSLSKVVNAIQLMTIYSIFVISLL